MKKLIFSLFFCFTFIVFLSINANSSEATHSASELSRICSTMNVSVSLNPGSGSWPGGSISISCPGTGIQACNAAHGKVSTNLAPNQSDVLTACDCSQSGSACLNVNNQSPALSNGCLITEVTNGYACLTNGQSGSYNVKVTCPQPPTEVVTKAPTEAPTDPPNNPECVGLNGACANAPCCDPNHVCTGADLRCHDFTTTPPPSSPTNTPRATRTPTPTSSVTPPTSTPTRTPTPTTPVSTATPTNSPTPTSSPTPTNSPSPTPSPTPDFNNAMCKCDSLNVGQINLGQPIQMEAIAKVEGQDTSKAVVAGMKFRIYEGNASVGRVRELPEKADQPVTEMPGSTASLVRYRAEWTANPEIKIGEEYRIVATPDCQARQAANLRDLQRVVLAERDENVGFFGHIRNFFAGLFGGGTVENEGVQVAEEPKTPLEVISNFFRPQGTTQRNQLQLETFRPAQMNKEACNIMFFKFENLP